MRTQIAIYIVSGAMVACQVGGTLFDNDYLRVFYHCQLFAGTYSKILLILIMPLLCLCLNNQDLPQDWSGMSE